MSPQKTHLFAEVLLACALAKGDEQGYFTPSDVRLPLQTITGKNYDIPDFAKHLVLFCEEDRGSILKRIGVKRSYRYRFSNPLVQPFVILKGIADGAVSYDNLQLVENFGADKRNA